MNKEKLIENWDELKDETKKQILELADKVLNEEPFIPKMNEVYYYIEHIGAPVELPSERKFADSPLDDDFIKIGNCFRTSEEVKFYRDCEYCTKRFETYVTRHTDKLDWDDDEQLKHFVYYVNDDKKIRYCFDLCDKLQGTTYASSDEILEDAIDDIGEENFLKYVMKIKTDKES